MDEKNSELLSAVLDGVATDAEHKLFEALCRTDAELETHLKEHRAVAALCDSLANEHHSIDDAFLDDVMEAIAEEEIRGVDEAELPMEFTSIRRLHYLAGALSSIASALVVVLISMLYSPEASLSRATYAMVRPDASSAMGQYGQSGLELRVRTDSLTLPQSEALVHVALRIGDGDTQHDVELAKFVRLVSSNRYSDDLAVLRLAASPEVLHRIELARVLGEVRLSPVGASDVHEMRNAERAPNEFTIRDPEGRPIVENLTQPVQAVLYMKKDKHGPLQSSVYVQGEWKPIEEASMLAF